MVIESSPEYDIIATEGFVWLQANKVFGNMVPELSSDAVSNRERGVKLLQKFTTASTVARMKPGEAPFVDITNVDSVEPLYFAEGIITSNPEHILHANPADCGEIALFGFGLRYEEPVAAILHASRSAINRGTYLGALDYISREYQISPDEMTVIMSPSARKDSYAFNYIDDDQLASGAWRNFIHQDNEGAWHIDLHGRTVNDLLNFGINDAAITALDADTISDKSYFSHYRRTRLTKEPIGGNGLLFALRK